MNNEQRFLNLLGIAMRAGKLISGEETTLNSVRSNKVNLVIVASDVSQNTEKKMRDKCGSYETPIIVAFNKMELSHAIGKSRAIIGVCDAGFSRKLSDLMKE